MASSIKSLYLVLYNGTFAALWLTLLIRIVALGPLTSHEKTYDAVGNFALWVQSAALLEVAHAATGPLISPADHHSWVVSKGRGRVINFRP